MSTLSLSLEEAKLLLKHSQLEIYLEARGGPDYSLMVCPSCTVCINTDDPVSLYMSFEEFKETAELINYVHLNTNKSNALERFNQIYLYSLDDDLVKKYFSKFIRHDNTCQLEKLTHLNQKILNFVAK